MGARARKLGDAGRREIPPSPLTKLSVQAAKPMNELK